MSGKQNIQNDQWQIEKVLWHDWIFENGIVKYRVKWLRRLFKKEQWLTSEIQDFIEYFRNDIVEIFEFGDYVGFKWRDLYVSKKYILQNVSILT